MECPDRGSIRSFRGTSGSNWTALGFRHSSLKILGGFLPLARCLLSHPESINLGSSCLLDLFHKMHLIACHSAICFQCEMHCFESSHFKVAFTFFILYSLFLCNNSSWYYFSSKILHMFQIQTIAKQFIVCLNGKLFFFQKLNPYSIWLKYSKYISIC